MKLHDLVNERIAIQCHNIPDADALASGYGLFRFFEAECSVPPKFFYCGPPVTKPSLTTMIKELSIPVEHAPDLAEWDGLLIVVDSQYGAGNIARVAANRVAVVDHHVQETDLPPACALRPWLGSCSTLVWELLREVDFPIDIKLGTALLYGLFTDTNGFSEIRHPLDRDMWDTLSVNQKIFKSLKRSNLTLSDLSTASAALKNLYFDTSGRFVVAPTPPCDPNLLGFISDLIMQVDSVDFAIVFAEINDEYKFSVRSTVREMRASELAAWLAGNVGSGGGHREKAGGYISKAKYEQRFGDQSLRSYFTVNMKDYREAFKIIDCGSPGALSDENLMNAMNTYRKLPVRLGFVLCHKLFEGRVDLRIRMLEGDVDITADEGTVLMIGVKGEVYPIELEKFIESYTLTGDNFALELLYPPTVLNRNTGVNLPLMKFAGVCVGADNSVVRALCLEDRVKVFTRWDEENYLRGDRGDWLVARSFDDLYVVTADVFDRLYIRDCTGEDIFRKKGAVRVVKKSPVSVVFASEAGILNTREGQVAYEEGDALLYGIGGESWPVERELFFKTYAPAFDDIEPGQNGEYRKKEIPAWALQINEPFMLELPKQKGTLRGLVGDWLLQYSADEYGIVGREIFNATYVAI